MAEAGKTRHSRRTFEGEVVKDGMDKSITVVVRKKVLHSLYKKYYTRRYRYMAHDPDNACHVGDIVRIEECRPISKRKHWRVSAVIKKIG
ncbi:MAG: 30S ribosomal protein S17 [Deltaproteobacteria bacterium]|nr:30S ribosomal protein S17 [Deltaproteobacteria bacterium]